MGVTVITASGDYGPAGSQAAGGCLGNGTNSRFSPSWAASCPWITAIGGTQLLGQSATAKSENIISKEWGLVHKTNETSFYTIIGGDTVISSGGGFSNIFGVPKYQQEYISRYRETEQAHLAPTQDKFNPYGRAYPDLSLQSFGYLISLYEKVSVVHGTSGAAPVFASMVTMINSERLNAGKPPVGFINPALYAHPEIFNDVTTGFNEGCGVKPAFRATKGWDAVTGLGSPDYLRLRDLFMGLL